MLPFSAKTKTDPASLWIKSSHDIYNVFLMHLRQGA